MVLNEENITKRLKTLTSTQDSIQTVSSWILHHKDSSIDKIAKCWMDVFRTGEDSLRISLIYVMNDVVQKSTKKDRKSPNDMVKMAFHPHVVNAFGMAGKDIQKPIRRCLEVFYERHVFPSHILEEMKAALYKKPPISETEDGFIDIDNSSLIRDIEAYYQNEELTEKARNILARSDFNFKEKMQDRMKDRVGGTKILGEMDDSKKKLSQFLGSVERHQNKCQKLIDYLKVVKSSLKMQLRDVTVVDDAYEKFEKGINDTKKELEIIIKNETFFGSSPPRDAPSPQPNEDPFAHGFIQTACEDMDLDDDETPVQGSTTSSLIPSKDYVTPLPTIPVTTALDPRLQRLINQKQMNQESGLNTFSNTNSIDPRQNSRQLPLTTTTTTKTTTSMDSKIEIYSPSSIRIDTTQPPPNFFATSASSPLVPPSFNPNNPPPSNPAYNFMSPPPMSHYPIGTAPPIPSSTLRVPLPIPLLTSPTTPPTIPLPIGGGQIYSIPPPGFVNVPKLSSQPSDGQQQQQQQTMPQFTPISSTPGSLKFHNNSPQKRRYSDSKSTGNGNNEGVGSNCGNKYYDNNKRHNNNNNYDNDGGRRSFGSNQKRSRNSNW